MTAPLKMVGSMAGPVKLVGKVTTERLTGLGPGPVRAAAAATVVGAASAIATYKLLRSGD